MVIVEGRRFGVRDRLVFFPDGSQLSGLLERLRPIDTLRVRQTDVELTEHPGLISRSLFRTSWILLERDDDALLADMNKTSRNEIRKLERLAGRVEVRRGRADLAGDFLSVYERFVRRKGHSRPMRRRRLMEYLRVSELWMTYLDGSPACGHLMLLDPEVRRIRFLYEANVRFDKDEAARLASPMNRHLHWTAFRRYREEGYGVYDMGGIGDGEGSIARFKLSLGGERTEERSYILAGSIGRVALAAQRSLREARR